VTSCKDVCGFLGQVSARTVTAPLGEADLSRLAALGLIQFVTSEQYRQMAAEVNAIALRQAALGQESEERSLAASELGRDYTRDHSILFHLHGKETQAADLEQEAKAREQLQAIDADLAQREQAFNALLAERALFDGLTPMGDRSVGLTAAGAIALRDLTVRLYRYADTDFEAYVAQAQRIDQELDSLATGGANYFAGLSGPLASADRAYLWAIGIGLAKSQPDLATGVPRFLEAYRATGPLSSNPENRLMASEILVAVPRPLPEAIPALTQLVRDVRKIHVPEASALGVASIVLFGQRADGSFATENVQQFLRTTKSYESAALLGIVNAPADALAARFAALRSLFSGWGYDYSEDTELSAAYLAVSDFDPDRTSAKLAIIARGLTAYLQYPLVAASILASIPTLEANETLNVVEKAYAIVGRRASGLRQAELICLAVRMIHGIRNELVGALDATAAVAPGGPSAVGYGYGPRWFFLPVVIVHGGYYSTYGGISGVHPGHVHGMPTGFGGAGVG
jgi:hypothetical protein